jgi:mono/diheme cytochrome c family protein
MRTSAVLLAVVALLALTLPQSALSPAAPVPDAKSVNDEVRQFLTKHCQECHGTQKPKGNFHLDELRDFADRTARERWQAVLERVQSTSDKQRMPPKTKPRPPEEEIKVVTGWIGGQMESAEATERAQGRTVRRRLNRSEYENTIRDLLGVDADLKELLALDSATAGFDNVGAGLHVSSFSMERYLDAADSALTMAIANRPKPPPLIKKRYSLTEAHQVKSTMERVFRKFDDGTLVCFTSVPWQAVTLPQFYPPDRGRYRFRISASGFQSSGKPVVFNASVSGRDGRHVGYFDAPPDKPAVIEFVIRMEARTTISILPYGLADSRVVSKEGADNYQGPGLAVQWVDVEGPLHDTWPPASHRRLFGELAQAPAPIPNVADRVEVTSKDPTADATRILRTFAGRAFRRAVTDDDLKPYLALVNARLAKGRSFEQAVRAGLLGIMVSPRFLFLDEKPGPLDDFALASRLSYFLWSTMPDDELLALAEQKKLGQPDTLRQQVERMLQSPKAAALSENFVGQWLGLREIDATDPSHLVYPEFDQMLKRSMVREPELFFAEVLKDDLSLTNFVASDFSMLNGRLAKHYGIPGVEGWGFRKVALPAESHRGGVMTMAGVLKVTANGTDTSPVLRGAWVLDRILGTPPPPPPANVAALEADTRGATTIRERLARHRTESACAACHAKIDPAGFALESFDVIGGWRESYRLGGWARGAKPVKGAHYYEGAAVDPSDVMPDGQRFRNIDEFKQLLLKDQDQLARALTEKLLVYATGAVPARADRQEIEAIVRQVRDKKYGLRTLVHAIVQSKPFQQK